MMTSNGGDLPLAGIMGGQEAIAGQEGGEAALAQDYGGVQTNADYQVDDASLDMMVGFKRDMWEADMELPDMELPDMELPDMELPDMELPDMELPDMELPDMDLSGAQIREVCEGSSDCAYGLECLAWPTGNFCTPSCGYNPPASGLPSDPPCPAGYSLVCHVSNNCLPALCRDGCDPGYVCDTSGRCKLE